jgi:hypothetical protein
MEAKIPSGLSPGLAQKKHTSDHPLGRILEPLGFYRHPILYDAVSNPLARILEPLGFYRHPILYDAVSNPLALAANPRREGSRFVFSHLSSYLLSFVDNTVMQIRVVITVGT